MSKHVAFTASRHSRLNSFWEQVSVQVKQAGLHASEIDGPHWTFSTVRRDKAQTDHTGYLGATAFDVQGCARGELDWLQGRRKMLWGVINLKLA